MATSVTTHGEKAIKTGLTVEQIIKTWDNGHAARRKTNPGASDGKGVERKPPTTTKKATKPVKKQPTKKAAVKKPAAKKATARTATPRKAAPRKATTEPARDASVTDISKKRAAKKATPKKGARNAGK